MATPEFRGAALELGRCRDLEVCLDGPAGTGKTFACLFKVHIMLSLYPGSKALVARKTNTALAGSAMATFREMLDPDENVYYYGGSKVRPAAFIYPNGSQMIVTGLDRRDKIKSYEFDLAYLNEATEMDEEDVEYVRSRMRHGKMPYHQVIMDCNPDAPEHWLNVRMESGKTRRLLSRHEDNPRFFDRKTNDWTEAGKEYIFGVLGGLTGVLLERMRWGVWASALGIVYQGLWDRKQNVVKRFPLGKDYARYLCIDFGYSNPFVCKWYAQDYDGRLYVYREIYKTQMLVEDAAKEILIQSGWFHLLPKDHAQYKNHPAEWADPLPRAIICDHALEDRMTLEKHLQLYTVPARKSVTDGIQVVGGRLKLAGDGKPRLLYFDGCLVEPDQVLIKQKKPKCSVEEFNFYIWKINPDGSASDEPVKKFDHGMDCDRYMCMHLEQPSGVSYMPTIWN